MKSEEKVKKSSEEETTTSRLSGWVLCLVVVLRYLSQTFDTQGENGMNTNTRTNFRKVHQLISIE
jgi:hypothetical protein